MKNKLFLLIYVIPMFLFAQQKQPKVGLVLSGGGAKGFAHIAVLKEIDKAGIQLDYIGGTSMGAIIGGMYAAGYSADQIEKIILETAYKKIFFFSNFKKNKIEIRKNISPNIELSGHIVFPLNDADTNNIDEKKNK